MKITLDIPQIFTAHSINTSKLEEMNNIFKNIKAIRHNILGIHLWGKRKSASGRKVAHSGDWNSYF